MAKQARRLGKANIQKIGCLQPCYAQLGGKAANAARRITPMRRGNGQSVAAAPQGSIRREWFSEESISNNYDCPGIRGLASVDPITHRVCDGLLHGHLPPIITQPTHLFSRKDGAHALNGVTVEPALTRREKLNFRGVREMTRSSKHSCRCAWLTAPERSDACHANKMTLDVWNCNNPHSMQPLAQGSHCCIRQLRGGEYGREFKRCGVPPDKPIDP